MGDICVLLHGAFLVQWSPQTYQLETVNLESSDVFMFGNIGIPGI